MSNVNELSREDCLRIMARDRWVKEQLSNRVAALVHENLELMSIIQELQKDLADVRQSEEMLFAANGGVEPDQQVPADVTS